jgi:hypothetical protein
MANILLIQPPIYKSEYPARGSKHTLSILPPMGLAYIAAYLQQHGHHCEIWCFASVGNGRQGPMNRATDATNCFFPRRVSRITRAQESPRIPTTVRSGIKPGNRYQSLSVFFLMYDSYHIFQNKDKNKTANQSGSVSFSTHFYPLKLYMIHNLEPMVNVSDDCFHTT